MTTQSLCAGCGAPIPREWVITPSLCERCEEQIRAAETAWRPNQPETESDHDQPVEP